jgi:hypothetical protein
VTRPASATTLLGWGVALACFVYLLLLPPTLNPADESFALYGAKRVLEGDVPYRDFFDFQTPLSFYLYALAYAVGGVSITSARVTTALLNAVSAACVYFLSLRVAAPAEAVLAALLAVVICVPVWNMAGHHWLATTLALASAAVLLAPHWRDSTRARPAAAGVLAGLVVCASASRGVGMVVWLALVVPALALARGGQARWRRCVRETAWAAAGGAAACIGVLGHAVWRASLDEVVYAVYGWVVTNYRAVNVGKMPWGGALWKEMNAYTWPWLFRSFPAILGVEVLALLLALRRHPVDVLLERAALLLLALTAVAGIQYFPDVIHVAFVAPFVLVVVAGMAFRLRRALPQARTPPMRAVARLAFIVVLALVLTKAWTNWRLAWRVNAVRFETAFGTLMAPEVSVGMYHDLRGHLRRLAPADSGGRLRLFAYPTDAWVYLALPADNPTRFALLRPVYNTTEQIQESIDRLDREPGALVLVNRLFLKPDDPVLAWLGEHWRQVAAMGPPLPAGGTMYTLYARAPRA